jgi:NADPH:quinone reductase-like Zn-dependent oxidoreductase
MKHGKAVRYREFGDFDVVDVVPIERPTPASGQVVVKVSAAGLNHIERFVREGRLRDHVSTQLPSGQGVDFAGIIVSVGDGVRTFRKGQEVLGHLAGAGTHATWIAVAASAIIPKPPTVTPEVGGGLYLAGCTALTSIRSLKLGTDDTVVVSAAAGGVGHLQIQLAVQLGAKVLALGSTENHDFLRALRVIPVDYAEGVEGRIRDITGDRPVTAFIDNHGGYELLASSLGVPLHRILRSRDRREIEVRYLTAPADDSDALADFSSIVEMVAERRISVVVSGFYPFDYVTQAYQDLARMHSRGKVVIGMDAVEFGPRQGWYLTEKARSRRQRVETDDPSDTTNRSLAAGTE